jgi:uncharacterized protein (DUF427 family)
LADKTQISIWHEASGTLLARGPKGWGITPFEGNYYVSGKYFAGKPFRSTMIPGLCPYKGIYHWLHLELPEGQRENMLAWRYVIPNPLFPFIAFRVALPGQHEALRYEQTALS